MSQNCAGGTGFRPRSSSDADSDDPSSDFGPLFRPRILRLPNPVAPPRHNLHVLASRASRRRPIEQPLQPPEQNCGAPTQSEVHTAWVKGEDLGAISGEEVRRMLRGQHATAWYFLWPSRGSRCEAWGSRHKGKHHFWIGGSWPSAHRSDAINCRAYRFQGNAHRRCQYSRVIREDGRH